MFIIKNIQNFEIFDTNYNLTSRSVFERDVENKLYILVSMKRYKAFMRN